MKNPLSVKYSEDEHINLFNKSLQGDKKSLNQLITLHEPFIYNVAWKYTNNQEEAKDLTQEVLIKVITNLSSFKGKSSFRTWVYRIVVNQFMQTKRRPMESRWESFDDFANELNALPNPELSAEEEIAQEFRTKTARTRCMSGMLMCLTREQRLMYILGDVFSIDHNVGAEIFNLSKENYRVKLSRTRKEFHAFMNEQCGLVHKDNPCRCSKKAKAMEAAGKLKVDEKLFNPKYTSTISKYVEEVADEVSDIVDRKYIDFFQKHPAKTDLGAETIVNEIINDDNLHKYFS
jgi:RNA polymerase sigma factor (sigma-70 family)